MNSIGIPGLILILVLALVLFGPKKLPELGRAVGHTLKEFKNATRGLTKDDDEDDDHKETPKQVLIADKEKEAAERERIEKEVRERLERERLEAEIREKLEKERQQTKVEQPKA